MNRTQLPAVSRKLMEDEDMTMFDRLKPSTATSRPALLLAAYWLSACGGRMDVADLDDDRASVKAADEAAGQAPQDASPSNDLPGSTASATAIGPVSTTSADLGPGVCYDPANEALWDPGESGGLVLPVPDAGCEYSVTGGEESCEGVFDCCGDLYRISYQRDSGLGESTNWGSPNGGSRSAGSTEPGAGCPLLDQGAADVASDGFGYSPAWYVAVEALPDPDANSAPTQFPEPPLDPIPIGCVFEGSPDDCNGTMTCPEHQYYAGVDEDDELVCMRDGTRVEPRAPDAPDAGCIGVGSPASVPANRCFGPGWSPYFQLAGEPQ
jgi:hypothetical protein